MKKLEYSFPFFCPPPKRVLNQCVPGDAIAEWDTEKDKPKDDGEVWWVESLDEDGTPVGYKLSLEDEPLRRWDRGDFFKVDHRLGEC